jgi:hypothetical protein
MGKRGAHLTRPGLEWYPWYMATDSTTPFTDAELFYQYLGRRLDDGGREASIAELLAEFAEYRRELEEVRAKIREAEGASARGESGPLDLDALFARADKQLGDEGIPE